MRFLKQIWKIENFKKLDYALIVMMTLIVLYGVITIGNAMSNPYAATGEGGLTDLQAVIDPYYVRLQLLWFAIGLFLMAITVIVDYTLYGRLAYVIYGLNLLLLVLVKLAGSTINGTQGWFSWGENAERGFQPSELAKLSMIIFLAKYIARFDEGIRNWKQLLQVLGFFALPFILILWQPDLGTAMVYLAILAGMLFIGNTSMKLLGILAGAGVAALPLAWMLMGDIQRARIEVFLNPDAASADSIRHLNQSLRAIGSGQFSGKGLFSTGSMSQLNYIAERHTDFIFAVCAETFGFIGALLLLLMYAFLLFRLMAIAMGTRDRFGALMTVGILSMLLFHIYENIGMTIGIMPITGIPLPLFSYGGSSMWTNMLALGIALNVGMRSQRYRMESGAGGAKVRFRDRGLFAARDQSVI